MDRHFFGQRSVGPSVGLSISLFVHPSVYRSFTFQRSQSDVNIEYSVLVIQRGDKGEIEGKFSSVLERDFIR